MMVSHSRIADFASFNAGFSITCATPAALAPRTNALAASRPVRTPPVAMRGSSQSVALPASKMQVGVGIPQSQKVTPSRLCIASPLAFARVVLDGGERRSPCSSDVNGGDFRLSEEAGDFAADPRTALLHYHRAAEFM